MMIRLALPAIIVFAAMLAYTQETAPMEETPDPAAISQDASSEVVTLEPEPARPRGDLLTLKSGQVIEGLQILRTDGAYYVLEIIEGITLNIPRRQVVSVDYDDFDPVADRRKSTMIRGQRLSDTLEAKLDTDISDPPFEYQDADLVKVIDEIKDRVDGTLTVDPSVIETMPPPSRAWTVASEPGMTLGILLRKELLADFPSLVMIFKDDEIILTTKAAASSAEPETANESNPPPPQESSVEPTL